MKETYVLLIYSQSWPFKIAWEKPTAYLLILGCSCHTKPERCPHTMQCFVWIYVQMCSSGWHFSLKANKCHSFSFIMWSTLSSRTGLPACLDSKIFLIFFPMVLILCYCFLCDSRIAAYVPQCKCICFASRQLLFFFEHHTRKCSAFVTFDFLIVLDHFYFRVTVDQNISSLVKEKKKKKAKQTLDNEQSWDVRKCAVLIQRTGLFFLSFLIRASSILFYHMHSVSIFPREILLWRTSKVIDVSCST